MNDEQTRLAYLFERYFQKTASPEEKAELAKLVNDAANKKEVMLLLMKAWEKYQGDGMIVPSEKSEKILEYILGSNSSAAGLYPMSPNHSSAAVITRWRKFAAVAAVFLLIVAGLWFFVNSRQTGNHPIAIQPAKIQDIPPGANGAILTLDNGEQIILDSAKDGKLAQQGASTIIKHANGLSYQSGANGDKVVYNTVTTPRGRQYPNLILADGSKVWLDAGSSIRFPVSFTGGVRKVEVTGQLWFDIVHNDKMPFKVVVKGTEIIDLGTQFNVNAYDDEPNIKVTLLQGAVSIQSVTLKPGQQAQIPPGSRLHIAGNVNLEEVMAWKSGFFNFHNADIKTVMRQLSRWYDVEVSYQGSIPDQQFNGEIGRGLTLKEVLEGLAFTNVRFNIEEGRKLIILP